jgi:hypothetical protein
MHNPLNIKNYASHKSDNAWGILILQVSEQLNGALRESPQKTSGTTISAGTACRE